MISDASLRVATYNVHACIARDGRGVARIVEVLAALACDVVALQEVDVGVRRSGAVATVRLERPEVHNAFDDALVAGLVRCLLALGADPAVRVVVLEGSGASFSAGADLHWMRRMAACLALAITA